MGSNHGVQLINTLSDLLGPAFLIMLGVFGVVGMWIFVQGLIDLFQKNPGPRVGPWRKMFGGAALIGLPGMAAWSTTLFLGSDASSLIDFAPPEQTFYQQAVTLGLAIGVFVGYYHLAQVFFILFAGEEGHGPDFYFAALRRLVWATILIGIFTSYSYLAYVLGLDFSLTRYKW